MTRRVKNKRRFTVADGGKNGDSPPSPDEISAFESVLDMTPEGLSATHDFLRLMGTVIGQITLLSIATGSEGPSAPRVAAARALRDLEETPEAIAERLRSTQFEGLDTKDLHTIVEKIREGVNPQVALAEVVNAKRA